MDYSEKDVENLNKIIEALTKTSIGTVPEMLYGHSEFPGFNSPEDLDCRFYEDILISNDICSITDDWTPNSIPGGYKLIYLNNGGGAIIRSKMTIQDFLEQKKQNSNPTVIHVSGYAIIGNNNSNNKQGENL